LQPDAHPSKLVAQLVRRLEVAVQLCAVPRRQELLDLLGVARRADVADALVVMAASAPARPSAAAATAAARPSAPSSRLVCGHRLLAPPLVPEVRDGLREVDLR